MKQGALITAGLLVAAVLLGCGSSGGTTTASSTTTKAAFDKGMEHLCERSEEIKFHDIGVAAKTGHMWPRNHEPTQADLEKITSAVVVPVFKQMTEKMREMPLPEGNEERVEHIISTFEGDVSAMEKEPARFVEGVAFKDGNAAASAYGLHQCNF